VITLLIKLVVHYVVYELLSHSVINLVIVIVPLDGSNVLDVGVEISLFGLFLLQLGYVDERLVLEIPGRRLYKCFLLGAFGRMEKSFLDIHYVHTHLLGGT